MPDQFELNLNHRFAPDRSLDDARRAVLDLCAGEAEVVFVDECPAAPPCAAHPLVQRLLTAGALGPEPKQAWTDVARFASLGVPAVNFGPGTNAQAHQRNEWTSLAKLAEGQAILARFFAALGEP